MRMCVMVILAVLSACTTGLSDNIYKWDFDDRLDCQGSIKLDTELNGQCIYASGIRGSAIQLGSEKYVTIENTATNHFTIICRIKIETSQEDIFIAGQENQYGCWKFIIDSESGTCRFNLNDEGHTKTCYGTINVTNGNWHNIAIQFDNKSATIITDGMLEDSVDAFELPKMETSIILGKDPDRFCKTLGGEFLLDELEYYDAILPVNEILEKCSYDKLLAEKFRGMYNDLEIRPIQLHRGGGMSLPENTLETFNYAWDLKMIPEADIRTTADNVIVCAHDSVFSRVAPGVTGRIANKTIDELTLNEVQSVDVGVYRGKPNQKIPTLSSVFAEMAKDNSKFIFLDYKQIALDRLAKMVHEYRIEDQVIFTTKNYLLIHKWKELMPDGQTMMWIGGTEDTVKNKLDFLRENKFKGLTIIQLHYKQEGKVFDLSDEFLSSVKAEMDQRGIILQILPWKIDDLFPYQKLVGMGITSFATDYPELMIQALNLQSESETETAGM